MSDALHDVQAPMGPQAAALFDLWTIMLIVCALVFVLVMAALAMALRRARRGGRAGSLAAPPDMARHPLRDSALRRAVGWATAVSTVLLIGLLFASFLTDRAIARLPLDDALQIELVAHQFWWEARYDVHDPKLVFFTANELHVPVGRPVLLTLRADDVIHSFWVPSLHGKKDLIPGRVSTFAFRADRSGVYRGQCAEFCGYQHAHMTLFVFADDPSDYERWASAQREPAAEPSNPVARRGRDLVVGTTCGLCHAIGGTNAQGRRAPDLTHIGSRRTLGAGAIANSEWSLADWVADPHRVKPGVNMPPHDYDAEDLAAIGAYLASLK
jgi:cytochrome c oxidase subunit 2